MKNEDLLEIKVAENKLKGCILGMCISDDRKEFDNVYEDAKGYLQLIYIITESRFDNLIKGEQK